MFKKACLQTKTFTQPLIIAAHFFDGSVVSGLGSVVIVNKEGWIMTAAHLMDWPIVYQQHKKELQKYQQAVQVIQNNPQLREQQKNKKISALQVNPKWILNYALMMGTKKLRILDQLIDKEQDVAFFKVPVEDLVQVQSYPVFRTATLDDVGTSLCKLGFPFHPVNAVFNREKNMFEFPPKLFPIAHFPSEGMLTRLVHKSVSKGRQVSFIEMSTPGLIGQSGGPVFNTQGEVYGMQSFTVSTPLNFKAVTADGQQPSNEMMHLGMAVPSAVLMKLMEQKGIAFRQN